MRKLFLISSLVLVMPTVNASSDIENKFFVAYQVAQFSNLPKTIENQLKTDSMIDQIIIKTLQQMGETSAITNYKNNRLFRSRLQQTLLDYLNSNQARNIYDNAATKVYDQTYTLQELKVQYRLNRSALGQTFLNNNAQTHMQMQQVLKTITEKYYNSAFDKQLESAVQKILQQITPEEGVSDISASQQIVHQSSSVIQTETNKSNFEQPVITQVQQPKLQQTSDNEKTKTIDGQVIMQTPQSTNSLAIMVEHVVSVPDKNTGSAEVLAENLVGEEVSQIQSKDLDTQHTPVVNLDGKAISQVISSPVEYETVQQSITTEVKAKVDSGQESVKSIQPLVSVTGHAGEKQQGDEEFLSLSGQSQNTTAEQSVKDLVHQDITSVAIEEKVNSASASVNNAAVVDVNKQEKVESLEQIATLVIKVERSDASSGKLKSNMDTGVTQLGGDSPRHEIGSEVAADKTVEGFIESGQPIDMPAQLVTHQVQKTVIQQKKNDQSTNDESKSKGVELPINTQDTHVEAGTAPKSIVHDKDMIQKDQGSSENLDVEQADSKVEEQEKIFTEAES